jgi:SAM-dependent methyltransferase
MESELLQQYYQLERNHWWFLVREKIIVQHIRRMLPAEPGAALNILNVGAAGGKTSEMLQQFGKVISVEIDSESCSFLRENLHLDVVQASCTALPFEDNLFDMVCVFDVLEHIENDRRAISELSRVCKPGGMIFITVPAYKFLWSSHDLVNHHFRRYTAGRLRKLINKDFQPVYLSYFNSILFPPIALARTMKRIFRLPKEIQSDFDRYKWVNNGWIAKPFKLLFTTEIFLLRHIKFPFGVSIIASAKKPAI